jgi:hypothetical protein
MDGWMFKKKKKKNPNNTNLTFVNASRCGITNEKPFDLCKSTWLLKVLEAAHKTK